ncbi:MAG: M1 family metallopeptidase [Flavobacteriales bacterium]|nr:M1 family metallopeptidase [Flavobacteriales bacterium]
MRGALYLILLLTPVTTLAQEYFQQWVDYTIEVTLDDEAHMLTGEIEMVYHNRSADVLEEIYIHLWPNAYSSRTTALAEQLRNTGQLDLEFSTESERGSIEGLAFTIDGEAVEFSAYNDHPDIAHIQLPKALAPGEQMTLSTPFKVKIPSSKISRLGHIGQSYQITQWYPKPAVYDSEGWHPMPYLNQGEFYSEFGSYHVTLTLPRNYVVGATGELQEESERQFMLELAEQHSTRPWQGMDNSFPPSSPETKTIHYHTDSVHDFAWFADKRFHVIHEQFSLDSGKEVDGWVLHTNRHADQWAKSMEYLIDGTRHYSKAVGEYPYSQVTVVDGTLAAGGGMEYPMITVINGTSDAKRLEQVIVHEIGHNWFYGILASNERTEAWMDEGINSYYEQRYFKEKYPDPEKGWADLLGTVSEDMPQFAYRLMACRHQDQALATHSLEFSPLNYGAIVYMKGALLMDHWESIWGKESFDKAMQDYFQRWKFKHPDAQDLLSSLEESTGESLGTSFQPLVESVIKTDHAMTDYDRADNSIGVRSKTAYTGPIRVGFFKDGEQVDSQVGEGEVFRISSKEDFDRAIIDPDARSLQSVRRNDVIRSSGILEKWAMPEFRPVIGTGLSRRPKVYYAPALGWNTHDELMLGGYLSNLEIIPKPLEWTLIPMYSTGEDDLSGLGNIRLTIYPTETAPDRFEVGLQVKRFTSALEDDISHRYLKLRPSFTYTYQDPARHKASHDIFYRLHYIYQESTGSESTESSELVFNEVGYAYGRSQGLTDTDGGLMLEFHDAYQKVTGEFSVEQIFDKNKNAWRLRLYGAKMWTREFPPLGATLSLAGQGASRRIDGTYDDYRYDHLLLARGEMEDLVAQQWVGNRGGFIHRTPFGTTDDWVIALNGEVDLPVPFPVSIFGNYGVYATSNDNESLYEAGVRLSLIDDFFDISFPVLSSSSITDYYDFQEIEYIETIRFQLRLDRVDIRYLIDRLSL